jgi:hypothetical protein
MSTYDSAEDVISDAMTVGEDVVPKDDVLLPPPAQPLKPVQDAAYNYVKGATVGTVQDAMNIGKMTGEEQKDLAFNAAVGLIPMRATPGVRGFMTRHASPYKFDKFDLEKIGTGEGYQDEGAGVYLSQAPKTHKFYKDLFSNDLRFPGMKPEEEEMIRNMAVLKSSAMKAAPGMEGPAVRKAALKHADQMQELLGYWDKQPDYAKVDRQAEIAALRKAAETDPTFRRKAHEYEVHVDADPNELLNWNERILAHPGGTREKLIDLIERTASPKGGPTHLGTGADLYNQLTELVGSQKRASEMLREQGVPGAQYKDYAAMRNPKIETRNYVMYDPGRTDIRKVWGLMGLLPGAGLAASAVSSGPTELKY